MALYLRKWEETASTCRLPRNNEVSLKAGGGGVTPYWAAIFLVVALVAAILGFAGIIGASAGIAQMLFVVFLTLFVATLLVGRRRPLA